MALQVPYSLLADLLWVLLKEHLPRTQEKL